MNTIGPLYHWSPRDRHNQIKKEGLQPGKCNHHGPTWHNGQDETDGEFLQPMICFSPSPATAWNYSHEAWGSTGTFDLWQVYPNQLDEIHILPVHGDMVAEIRVANGIPEHRLIWIGERTVEPK